MAELSPKGVVPEAPVADDFDVERSTNTRKKSAESVGGRRAIGQDDPLAAPLHGDWAEAPCPDAPLDLACCRLFVLLIGVVPRIFGGRIVEPKRAGVPRTGEWLGGPLACAPSRPNEQIGDIFK